MTSLGTDNTAVETGHNHIVVLKSNGTVWTFGLNSDGQLGDGSTTLRRSPVQVSGLTDAVGIAAGRDMSYAIRSNGQLMGWGRNDEGQLGDGTTTRRLTPVRVGASINFTGVKTLTGGRDHGVAVKTDGFVWAWGSNDYGQVGDGTNTDKLTPVAIDINGATAGLARPSTPPQARTTPTPCAPTEPSRRGVATTASSSVTAPAPARPVRSTCSWGPPAARRSAAP